MSIKSHRGRRPSLSSPMSWLTRSSSSHSQLAPARMSESKFSTIGPIRHATLGAGVTVVRTPQEALAGSGVSVEYVSDQESDEQREVDEDGHLVEEDEDAEEGEETEEEEQHSEHTDSHVEQSETPSVPPAYSPPRSSLPLSKSTPSLPLKGAYPARPTRPPPPPPSASDTAVLTQKKLPSTPVASMFPAVPPLPSRLATSSPPPPFECILLSSVPHSAIDFSKVLVTLETCTATHRTTLSTLTSRPSHLGSYLRSLFSDTDADTDADTASVYSHADVSSFNSIFHNHLTSSGLLPASALNVHIFLDRASASYDHILAYLRSPPATIDHAATLPHAAQMHAATPARIDALLALRDEAAYLGLPELAQLCTAELRRHAPPAHAQPSLAHAHAHVRGPSNSSLRSMDTLRERDEDGADADVGSTSTGRDSIGSAQSIGSMRGRPGAAAAAVMKEDVPRPSPAVLLHRRLASQSRERAEPIEVKSATLRGRPTGNWV
ncbi:hypothetical protein BC834DRAFT_842285 [Gloeopeniophorella convolvens]|nr:hypothetical protein BC834DRAFT_842285 [Gloeopeniophorella convolvens]